MIELRVLGPLHVTADDGRDVEPLLRQAKRAALLVYLAVAVPRRAHDRDELLALFWPESDEARARAALSQAIYVLRSILGGSAVGPRGGRQLGITAEGVWCDAVAFEAAIDAGRPAEALALYQGDLLDGFHVPGTPAFERWLEGERTRLRRRAFDGAWAVADRYAAEGDALEAARWGRRAANLSPGDESAIRRLMAVLQGVGDRAGALRAYEAFAWRLAEEYDLEPSAATRDLAAAIRSEDPDVSVMAPMKAWAGPSPTAHGGRGRRRNVRLWLACGLAALLLAGFALANMRAGGPAQPVTRFSLDFGGIPPLAQGIGGTTLAVSPDGSHLVYLGAGPDGAQLFLRPMDRLDASPIPHTLGARLPFFSPDGEWIGFVDGTLIRKVRRTGGPPVTISSAGAAVMGVSWGATGVIVFATPSGLWRVPAAGGAPEPLALNDTARGEAYRWPAVLYNGRAAVFTLVDHSGFMLASVSLQTGAVASLGVAGTSPTFVAPGQLVFARADGALLVAPFDPVRVRLRGPPVVVGEGVTVGIAGAAKIGVSRAGVLAYVPRQRAGSLVLVDRTGRVESEWSHLQGLAHPRFSPDGGIIAASMSPSGGVHPDLWLIESGPGVDRQITFDSGSVSPVWSPEGHIAYANTAGGRNFGFSIRRYDGAGDPRTILPPAHMQFHTAFTPDGGALVYQSAGADGRAGIWVLPLDEGGEPVPYSTGPDNHRAAALSRDGRWVAFVSDMTGRDEVFVGGFPERGRPVQISDAGGREPRWAHDGRTLFFRGPEGMMAATLDLTGAPRAVERAVLFDDGAYAWAVQGAAYDAHPGADRFAMVRRGAAAEEVIVVMNWFDQLRPRKKLWRIAERAEDFR